MNPVETTVCCPRCDRALTGEQLRESLYQCVGCGHLFPMPPTERIRMLSGGRGMKEFHGDLASQDPLRFPEYRTKLETAREKAKTTEAIVTGIIRIRELPVALAVMNGAFLMGSMGTVVGEKIAALAEYAGRRGLPMIIITASGGARMQEGLYSLMQMAKTAAAIERFRRSGGVYVTLLTHPTSGGVTASFGMLGDIILAEPEAMICFTGPRIVEQTIGESVTEDVRRAEYLLEHGMIDGICGRKDQEELLYRILKLHLRGRPGAAAEERAPAGNGESDG